MAFRIPSRDYFRRFAHGVLIFLLWQAACRNTTAMAFRSGFYLARKSPGFTQSNWGSPCCPSKRYPPKSHVYLQFRRRPETPSQKTSLAMGLRDLLKRRILGRKDDNDANNEETEGNHDSPSAASIGGAQAASDFSAKFEASAPSVSEISSQVEQQEPQQKAPKPERRVVRMAEDPSTGEVNVQKRFGAETVQEKINRVKAGKMTDEEKQAFLRTALSAGDTPLSRPPLLTKKGSGKDDLDAGQRARGKASPFPTDTIIRKSFSLGRGGNNMTTSRDLSGFDSSLDTQKKKREYLDMVTNPDRFRAYKAAPSEGGPPSPKSGSSSSSSVSDILSDRYDNNGGYFPGPSLSSSRNSPLVESSTSLPPPPPNMPPMPTDLGARLGAHALASEKIAADLRRQAEEDRREKERLMEEERREQEKRNQEALRQREAELLRREREVAERKRAQEEAVRKAEEERKRKEEERLRVMMQAQEEYWAKKLQAERSARGTTSGAGKGAKQGADPSTVAESTIDEDNTPPEVISSSTEEAGQLEDIGQPTGGGPLNDVARPRTEPQPSPWSWPQRTAADILGRNPRKPAASTSSNSLSDFQAEQARKKAEIERTKALQLERLKALNSPIPNRPASRGVTPSSGAFQPQYPASTTTSRGLGALSRTTQQPVPPPPPPQPLKDDSLDDMFPPPSTTLKTPSKVGGGLNDVVRPAAAAASRPAPPAVSSPPATVKPDFSSRASSPWAGLGNNAAKPKQEVVTKEKEVPVSNNVPKNKGPVIRQQLPFDDEDGIGRDAKGLSIAEVMKRVKNDDEDGSNQQDRSKKWGVDMSRFREK